MKGISFLQVSLITVLFMILSISTVLSMASSGEENDLILFVETEGFTDQLKCGFMYEPAYLNWSTNRENDPSIRITIELKQERGDWLPAAYKIYNTGSILLDPGTSGIPNGNDYRIRISADDQFGNTYHEVLPFNLSIWMDMEPEVDLHLKTKDETASGMLEIFWEAKNLFGMETETRIILNDWRTDELLEDLDIEYGESSAHLDTTGMRNNQWFIAKIIIDTGLGFDIHDASEPFRIYNEEMVGPGIMNLEAGYVLWDEFEIWCSPHPSMTKWSEMLSDMHIIHVESQETVYMMKNWEGDFSKRFNFSYFTQGAYDIFYLSRSLEENYTFREQLRVFVADRSTPIIEGLRMDRKFCDEEATILWDSKGTGLSGQDHFNVKIHFQRDMGDWKELCTIENDPGIIKIDTSGLEPGNYNIMLNIHNKYHPWLKDERTVTGIVIHHIFPPDFSAVICPGRKENVSGDIKIEWVVEDDPSENIQVNIYSRGISEEWRYITTREGRRGSYIWNTSEVISGIYQFKLVAIDDSKENLSSTWITNLFNVSGIEPHGRSGSLSNERSRLDQYASISGPAVASIIMLVPVLIMVSFMVLKRRRSSGGNGSRIEPFNIGAEAISVIEKRQQVLSQDALPGFGHSSASRSRSGTETEDQDRPVDVEGSQMEDILTVLGQDTNFKLMDEDLGSYFLLGLNENATEENIKRAHRDFARKYHPDRFNSMNESLRMKAEEEMKRRNRAKEILLDPRKRAMLDKRLRDDPTALVRQGIIT